MKKIIAMALVVICFCGLVGCSQKNDEVLHPGLNATVVEIDTSNHILYVTDLGNDEIFGDRCGIDCNEAIEKYNLCYVNYDAEDDVIAFCSAQFKADFASSIVKMIYTRPFSSIQPFLADRLMRSSSIPYSILASAEMFQNLSLVNNTFGTR